MSQTLTPVDGGEREITTSSSSPGVYLSRQYVLSKNLESRPSEWLTTGRPIYDRLPSSSENYKILFKEGEYESFVHIPVGESSLGRKSLNVVTAGEEKDFLVVQAGNVVWRRGTIPVNPVIINIRELGMWNTKYLLAYRLYFDDSSRVFQYAVEGFSLTGLDMEVESSTDTVVGWRYTSDLAFTGIEDRPWSNLDPVHPQHSANAFLEWQTPYPSSLSKIVLRCPRGRVVTSLATLKSLSCNGVTEEGGYCEDKSWDYSSNSSPKSDAEGQYYEFSFPEPQVKSGWRVEWDGPDVSVFRVEVDGLVSLKRRPEEGISVCELVAFPENSVPKDVDLGEGFSVEASYCNLALVDVNREYKAAKVSDIRQIVNTDYTPVADWLTQPWDENLTGLFNEVSNYSPRWMEPLACMSGEYDSIRNKSVEVV